MHRVQGVDLKHIDNINQVLVAVLRNIAIWVLCAMMFLTAADVLLRYLFNRPITGAFELVEYMMAILIAFSIVHCAHQRAHVNVDILIERLSKRTRATISCINTFLTLVLFILMTWQTFSYIIDEYESGLTSAVLYIPVYPFVTLVFIAFTILCLVILAEFLNRLSEAVSEWTRS
jgi:TRAP-type C4-dicarboxylate transport system permease small subunit